MKRKILLVILGLAAAGLFAQTGDTKGPKVVTVSGNLAVTGAGIGLRSGDDTYYVMGIDRLIGFVEGLKEGAPVTLEGYEFPVPADAEYRYLRVFRLNFNGKDYEVSPRLRQFAEGGDASGPVTGPEFAWGCPGFPGPGGGPRRNFRHHFDRR
jgi:hypothetical protein